MAISWRSIFAPGTWLRGYKPAWLTADLVAGITLAAYGIPVSLAYAGLAGLPPQTGLYGYLLGGLGYALFGTSRQLAIGPTSAISLTVGATLAELAGGDAVRALQIGSLTALVVAALCVVAWALRASALSSFISETILLGFKAGAGLTIASTQLAAFLGLPGGGDGFFGRLWYVAVHLAQFNAATALVGLGALALLLVGGRYLPGRPVALAVVALSIALVTFTSLRDAGMVLAGAVTPGVPSIGLPALRLRDVDGVIPLAVACLLLAYIEGLSAARTFAEKHGYAVDASQELLALGGANLCVALGGGYPVAGGLSQTAVNDQAGARSPLALLFASATIALCLLYLTGLVEALPKTVLSAIVLVAVSDLVKVKQIAGLRRISKTEFRVALTALVGVLVLGILKGVMLAAFASILLVLARGAQPHVAFLGRIPGTKRYSDMEASPDNEPIPGLAAFRTESSLFYFNVDYVLGHVLARVASAGGAEAVRQVICDLSTSPTVDLAGARMLAVLGERLRAQGIGFRVVSARSSARQMLDAIGLADELRAKERETLLTDAIEEFTRRGRA